MVGGVVGVWVVGMEGGEFGLWLGGWLFLGGVGRGEGSAEHGTGRGWGVLGWWWGMVG